MAKALDRRARLPTAVASVPARLLRRLRRRDDAPLSRPRARRGPDERVARAPRRSGAHRSQGADLDVGAGRAARVANVAADASPRAGGNADAGAGRRREHCRLQRRARGAPEASTVSGCRSSRRGVRGQQPRRRRALLPRVAAQLSIVGRARSELRRTGRLQRPGLHPHRAW